MSAWPRISRRNSKTARGRPEKWATGRYARRRRAGAGARPARCHQRPANWRTAGPWPKEPERLIGGVVYRLGGGRQSACDVNVDDALLSARRRNRPVRFRFPGTTRAALCSFRLARTPTRLFEVIREFLFEFQLIRHEIDFPGYQIDICSIVEGAGDAGELECVNQLRELDGDSHGSLRSRTTHSGHRGSPEADYPTPRVAMETKSSRKTFKTVGPK
jgi:hypothetical protein